METKRLILIKTNSVWDIFIHLGIMASLSVGFVLFLFVYLLPSMTDHGETVTVPDLVGMNVDEIKNYLSDKDLQFIIKDSTFSRKYKPNTVLSQSPEPGAKVKQSRKIYLVVSPKTPPKRKMPNLVDMPYADAIKTIKNMDLELGRVKYIPYIGQNVILEQKMNGKTIKEGDQLPAGSKIDLIVGDGIGDKEFLVPNIVGLSMEEAQMVLESYDLLIGNIIYDNHSNREIGTVLKQSPDVKQGKVRKGVAAYSPGDDRPNTMIRAGEMIDIWVAGNPAPNPELDQDTLYDEFDNINIRKGKDIENIEKRKKKKENKGKEEEDEETTESDEKDVIKE